MVRLIPVPAPIHADHVTALVRVTLSASEDEVVGALLAVSRVFVGVAAMLNALAEAAGEISDAEWQRRGEDASPPAPPQPAATE